MKPLLILLISFVLSLGIIRIVTGVFDWSLSMRLSMSIMLFFTGMAHFTKTIGMAMMIPVFLPFKTALVYFTGVLELAAALSLLLPSLQKMTGWLLILLFILMLAANIYAAANRIDYEKATYDGKGINYLWFRVPLQLLFIAWVYVGAIYL
jgi:uncharacterized membrane protein